MVDAYYYIDYNMHVFYDGAVLVLIRATMQCITSVEHVVEITNLLQIRKRENIYLNCVRNAIFQRQFMELVKIILYLPKSSQTSHINFAPSPLPHLLEVSDRHISTIDAVGSVLKRKN